MKFAIVMFAIFFTTLSWAETQEGLWAGVFGKTALDEKSSLWHEFQLRNNTESGSTGQTLFRFGYLQKFGEGHEAGLIYGFIRTGALSSEHRLTQQYSYTFSENFSTRWRLEQRVLEKNDGVSVRVRALIRFVQPLSEKFSVLAWNEIFGNVVRPRWIYDEGFDRNRAFIGFRSPFKSVALEYGYLNQYTNRAGVDLNEHLAVVYLYY